MPSNRSFIYRGWSSRFHTILPEVFHAFASKEINKTKYRLYCFGILKHVHTTFKNHVILQTELYFHMKRTK